MKRSYFLVLILLLTFSCEKKETAHKTLRTCIYSDPQSLDTRKVGDYISSEVLFMLYRGLMHYSASGELKPSLCKRYEISKDKKTYTFYLKKAFWSNKEPIDAYDFERSWKKILDPSFPSQYAELLYPIKNAERAKRGQIDINEVKVKAINSKILKVELEHPNPYFLFLTSFSSYFPMPKNIDEKITFNQNVNNLAFSGPFILDKWVRKSEIILKKNPYFYNKDKIDIDAIHISIISNEETAFQMYENNEIDFLSSFLSPLAIETLGKVKNRDDSKFIAIGGFSFLCFNTEKFPFNNKHLRKAFSLAIDRKKIVDNITQLNEPIALRCIPPIFLKGPNKGLIKNNEKELAKKHFEKALQELGVSKDKLKISFTFGSYVVHRKEAEALKQMLEDTFKISIKLNLVEDKILFSKLNKKEYQFALSRLIVRYNDPLNIFERFKYKNHPKNYSSWQDDNFIDILNLAKKEFDPEKRFRLIEAAESLLLEDMPITPMYFYNYTILTKKNIKGIYTNIVGDLIFDNTKILEEEIK
ncbi:MAG: Oligopeptide-binding protein OppA [Candidatus Anoxychlamydiales bacterium]|nr:Oligopeptide-binding protein OppA [Candidatus Anoxychlamydiales bacterium]